VVKLIPIFDTSAIVDLAKRDASDSIWRGLKRCVPARGCQLSFVTVLELFHGLSKGGAERLDDSLRAVNLASRLSRRKVLQLPIPFMLRELFQIKDQGAERSKENLKRYLRMAGQPNFKNEFMGDRLTFLDKIEVLMADTARGHTHYLDQFLDGKNPGWRLERQKSGSPLPEGAREKLKQTTPLGVWKRDLASRVVGVAMGSPTLKAVDRVCEHCDAYLTFSVSVLRDVLITNYRFEENPNDFHDGMQLLYLSRSLNCLVTQDGGLIHRVRRSSQTARILTLDEFVSRSAPAGDVLQ
jgi:hypothetical protein